MKNVDTTTVTASDGDCIVFDSSTAKFEASSGIDGGYYGVPISWGSLGLIYDVDEFGEGGVDSWAVMHDPANAGKMIVLDDTNNNIVNTAIYLGMDNPYNLSEAEMEQVKQTLMNLKEPYLD